MTNYCTSAYIVARMAEGAHPQDACDQLMRFMAKTAPDVAGGEYCVVALSPTGEIGAASMNAAMPLQYAVWRNGRGTLETAPAYQRR
jgi:hypothetical protein